MPAKYHTIPLLSAVAATGAGAASEMIRDSRHTPLTSGVCQAIVTSSATVLLEGSLNNTDWFTIATFTASGGQGVMVAPYMRGNVTVYASGTVSLLMSN